MLKYHSVWNEFQFYSSFRLDAGKFDDNLLKSICSAQNFILILTEGALDRCMNDVDQKDWIHKEVVCALNSNCNVVPVFDNFKKPQASDLPVQMRPLMKYNGVNWIHEYQNACVDKIERFLKTNTKQGNISTHNPRKLESSASQGTFSTDYFF